jgi:hypothetical protein
MKKFSILMVVLFMSSASSALTALRPVPESAAWSPHCECLNAEQLYFAKYF